MDLKNSPFEGTPSAFGEAASVIVPIVEERLTIDKRIVEKGGFRLEKRVHEEAVVVDEPLLREEVDVVRVAIGRAVSEAPAVRVEGNTTIYPVLAERVVSRVELVLVEELHVTRRQTTAHDPQTIVLRREEVTAERIGESSAAQGRIGGDS